MLGLRVDSVSAAKRKTWHRVVGLTAALLGGLAFLDTSRKIRRLTNDQGD
jgi:hypothetical protein